MPSVTFITGNQNKADYLAKLLGVELRHQKLELDEIQSLDLHDVVEHKVRQAYALINRPVLVEDVSLEFHALGRLPGTFIKFYVEDIPFETICRTLDGLDRGATARCSFGYYDGVDLKFIDGSLDGTIAMSPKGDGGYGWDKIFIPEGYDITRAEMSEAEDERTYQIIKPFDKLRKFLDTLPQT